MNDISIGVIARIPAPEEGGNLATGLDVMRKVERPDASNGYMGRFAPLGLGGLELGVPVFHLGEIIIMDGNGREIGGVGRKPSKWDVDCREFSDLEQAVAFARSLQ